MRFVFKPDDEGRARHAHFATDFPQEDGSGGAVIEEDAGSTLGAVVVSAAEQYSHMLQILEGYQTLPSRIIRIGAGEIGEGRKDVWSGLRVGLMDNVIEWKCIL